LPKTKILIFIGSLTSGGAERVTVTLSEYLSKLNKYSVTVVSLNEKDFDFYKLNSSVERIAMNMSGATSGLNKYIVNIKRVFAFRDIIKKRQPDIVLGMITRQAVISILACFGMQVKVVVSERNYPGRRKNHSMWEKLRKWFYKYADAHVVQTNKIAIWIRENTNAKNINIIPNSISWPIAVHPPILKPENYINKDEGLILAVGSFKKQKGFDLLVKSVSPILREFDGWKLVIIGDDVDEDGINKSDHRKLVESLIKDNGLSDRISLPGKAGNIIEWYQRADIFVLSSRFEGFPNVLLEAMASGTACISFDCDTGPQELIDHRKNGLLVEHLNTASLRSSIYELMEDSTLRKRLSKNAILVRDSFSDEIILKKWKDLFDELST